MEKTTRPRKHNSRISTPLDPVTCKAIKAYAKVHTWRKLADELFTTPNSITVLAQGTIPVSDRYKADIKRVLETGGLD